MNSTKALISAVLFATVSFTAGCDTQPVKANACIPPQGYDLDVAVSQSKSDLSDVCSFQFDAYLERLMNIAESDPKPANKEKFSEFLLWSNQAGLLSKQQAKLIYNRYFNVKYVSLMGDYNNCSLTCPKQQEVLANMERELLDKERGLVKISRDTNSYQRADRLLKETELVLEATCTACGAN